MVEAWSVTMEAAGFTKHCLSTKCGITSQKSIVLVCHYFVMHDKGGNWSWVIIWNDWSIPQHYSICVCIQDCVRQCSTSTPKYSSHNVYFIRWSYSALVSLVCSLWKWLPCRLFLQSIVSLMVCYNGPFTVIILDTCYCLRHTWYTGFKLALFSSSKSNVMKPILLGLLHLWNEIVSGQEVCQVI